MAHYQPLPQKGISPEIRQGQAALAFLAFEAKKRFDLRILNYVVTSNHIHLLVVDNAPDVILKSLQLIAGRTAQEFNQRKERKGAFWEDRYHATATHATAIMPERH